MVPGEVHLSDTPSGPHPIIPRTIRLAAIPILLCWLGFTVFVSVAVPPLEAIGETRAVAVAPDDAQSMRAMRRAERCSTNSIPIASRWSSWKAINH